jgi:hypothetical protein
MYLENAPSLITQIIDYAIAWLPAFFAYLLLRMAAVRAVLYFMMQKAKSTIVQVDEFITGKFQNISLSSHVYDSRYTILPTNSLSYARWQKALNSGNRSWRHFTIAWMIFSVTLSLVIFYAVKYSPSPGSGVVQSIFVELLPFILGSFLVVVFLMNATKRFLVGYVPFFSSFVWLLVTAVIALSVAIVYKLNWFLCALPGIFSLLYYFKAYRGRQLTNKQDENNRLLILRVFDADRNTAFTFGDISHFWRFVGSTITVADPSYLRFRYSLSYPRNKLRFMRIVFVISGVLSLISVLISGTTLINGQTTGLAAASHQTRIEILGVFAWLTLIPLALLPIFFIFKKRFIASQADLTSNLNRIKNERVTKDGVYQDVSLYCHSNAWKPAIHSLLDLSAVILMDLRGLTPDRAGSLYELDLIIHNVSLNNVVFLINDEAENLQLVSLLEDKIARAKETSPNRNVTDFKVNIYQPNRFESRDTERILALLASATTKRGLSHFSHSIISPSIWERCKILMAKPMLVWRILSEYIDMTLSRPPIAYAVIPVILVTVIGLFIFRIISIGGSLPNEPYSPSQTLVNNAPPAVHPSTNETKISLTNNIPLNSDYLPGSIEVLDFFAFSDWKGLSVRLNIPTPFADRALEMGLVKVIQSTADNQTIKISEVTTGLFSPNLLTDVVPIKRNSIISVSSNGNATSTRVNPHEAIRIWLRFSGIESVNTVNNIEGTLLLKLPKPANVSQFQITELKRKQTFAFQGVETIGLYTYQYDAKSGSLALSFEKALPKNMKIYLLESDGKRKIAMAKGRYSMGYGANKKQYYYQNFLVQSPLNIRFEIIRLDDMIDVQVPFHARRIPVEQR